MAKKVSHTLTITRPGARRGRRHHVGSGAGVSPVSQPPGYTFEFGPPRSRMHEYGHIWLNTDGPDVTIRLKIDSVASPNFVFVNNGVSSDGSLALFTSNDPTSKTQFKNFGGAFSAPTLDVGVWQALTFTMPNADGVVFYYQLNVLDQAANVVVTWDPIIVNQP
jgi:hypothetical protein